MTSFTPPRRSRRLPWPTLSIVSSCLITGSTNSSSPAAAHITPCSLSNFRFLPSFHRVPHLSRRILRKLLRKCWPHLPKVFHHEQNKFHSCRSLLPPASACPKTLRKPSPSLSSLMKRFTSARQICLLRPARAVRPSSAKSPMPLPAKASTFWELGLLCVWRHLDNRVIPGGARSPSVSGLSSRRLFCSDLPAACVECFGFLLWLATRSPRPWKATWH